MKKLTLIVLVLHTFSFAYTIKSPAAQEKLVLKAKKYYAGNVVKQDFKKARNILLETCGDNFGCDLLTDIMVGRTPEVAKRVPAMKVPKSALTYKDSFYDVQALLRGDAINDTMASFDYLTRMQPLEAMVRFMELPKSDSWRLSLRLYNLVSAQKNTVNTYLVVADKIDSAKSGTIERYAFVFRIIPRAAGRLEIMSFSQNSFDAIAYPCGIYTSCMDLDEKIAGSWTSNSSMFGNSKGYLEKAPWNKTLNSAATVTRALEKLHGEEKDVGENRTSPSRVLTITRKKDLYEVVMKEQVMDDAIAFELTKAVYNTKGFDEASISTSVICGRMHSSKLPVEQCQ